jgi:hypothetical protein
MTGICFLFSLVFNCSAGSVREEQAFVKWQRAGGVTGFVHAQLSTLMCLASTFCQNAGRSISLACTR